MNINYTVGVLGSHSAEEVGISAKSNNFATLVVCQKGRDELYTKYNNFLFTHKIVLEKFNDLIKPENIDRLQNLNVIWFPNRSFSVYVDLIFIENIGAFPIPIYGNRSLLGIEDRRSQYELLDKAGIRRPVEFNSPDEIDCLAIVKVQQKHKPLERAFFYVKSLEEYELKSNKLIKDDIIDEADLKNSVIEEFVIGPRFNANFQSYGLEDCFGEFDFVGFDDRVQVNLSGLLNLPAKDQLGLEDFSITNEEIGHKGVTMRESKKPLVYAAAEKFVESTRKEFFPGIIGLFALQGAINQEGDFVVFDISPRIPGSPCLGPTSPEMRRLSLKHRRDIHSPLDLCMMDLREAIKTNRLDEVTT
jgi:5-formaminoimidazole-4-carboxamide-1-(beta)-D-ribofuranosyl 5'-monophosphate synthetase